MALSQRIAAPAGMTGLAVEPWAKGEVYAVAANWAQASCPIRVYGCNGWDYDDHGRQVANFRHSPEAALRAIIESAIEAGGETPQEEDIDDILDDAEELIDADVAEMAEMLERHGDRFIGNNAIDMADAWIEAGFSADDADDWCEIGVWEPEIAVSLRDARVTPDCAAEASRRLIDAEEDAAEIYTDGCPIYAACNRDISVDVLIQACE